MCGSRQSVALSRRNSAPAHTMSRLPFLLLAITELIRVQPALVTDNPTRHRLNQLYQQLESLTLPPETSRDQPIVTDNPTKRRYYQLHQQLESLTLQPESLRDQPEAKIDWNSIESSDYESVVDDDSDLLAAMQKWGNLSEEQLQDLARGLYQSRVDDEDDGDDDEAAQEWDWNDDDYANDDQEDWNGDGEEDELDGTRLSDDGGVMARVSMDPVEATRKRPGIYQPAQKERKAVRKAAYEHIHSIFRQQENRECLTPQPRWLNVHKLRLDAGFTYTPPCVQLHRCVNDSGCCHKPNQICAPVEGKHVNISFMIIAANAKSYPVLVEFFNHTKCDCVTKERDIPVWRQETGWRPVEGMKGESQLETRAAPRTEEPVTESRDEVDTTEAVLTDRCICPSLFMSRRHEAACHCVCDWPDHDRRRDCLSLARGHEHFGMRDRECINNGDCSKPACDHGQYVPSNGQCPLRKFRRWRTRDRGFRNQVRVVV